jgi:predicted transcriptional regulator
MPRKPTPRPTDAELAILRVLWDHGPGTVREVQSHLGDGVGYTTVLKMLQIMTEKELVGRDETQRAHVYRALVGEEQTQQHLLGDLVDRAFQGSTARLVMQALSTRRATPEELAEIRRWIERMTEES